MRAEATINGGIGGSGDISNGGIRGDGRNLGIGGDTSSGVGEDDNVIVDRSGDLEAMEVLVVVVKYR